MPRTSATRDIGFGVSAIGILLAARHTPEWTNALRLQRETLLEEQHAAQGSRLTHQQIARAKGEATMSITRQPHDRPRDDGRSPASAAPSPPTPTRVSSGTHDARAERLVDHADRTLRGHRTR